MPLRISRRLVSVMVVLLAGGFVLAQDPSATQPAGRVELTNYRGGISLLPQGQNGTDFVVERYYHDAPIDDRGVIYIRSGTKMVLEHNEFNVFINSTYSPFQQVGINGRDGKPNSGDEGIIRYRVDRDQLLGLPWAPEDPKLDPSKLAPAYDKPFSFAELEFEPGVKVLGSVGPKPDAKRGPGFYYRGIRDACGDQWHTITVADDDSAFQNNSRQMASDGKIYVLVVDPQTPCLSLRTRTPQAQYYTNAAKVYFLPRILEQFSYVTDGVDLLLTNITNDKPMFCRLDGGAEKRYDTPLRSEDLPDGRHELTFWIEGGPKKTRTVIKNPPSPSAGETHPRLFWANDAELAALKARLQREPYKPYWDNLHGKYLHHDAIDKVLGRGGRQWSGSALENALVAYIDGVKTAPGGQRTCASYAKQVLLDNKLRLDPVGLELLHHTNPVPTPEWNYFGYYVVNDIFDLAFGYDMLIGIYRADQVPGGITPIEDLKIRDSLAHYIIVQLLELRGWESSPDVYRKADPNPGDGMWDTARHCGSAVAAMAMPSYDTPYFGTSGFDGKTKATHPGLPFDEQAFTWKEIYIDSDQTVQDTPKLHRRFDPFNGGLIKKDGSWHDRMPYYSYPQLGHCMLKMANTAKLTCGKSWPYLEKSFELAIDGKLTGHKNNDPGDVGEKQFVQILLVNARFPKLAGKIRDFVGTQQPTKAGGKKNENYISNQLYETFPFGLFWYQDDFDKSGK